MSQAHENEHHGHDAHHEETHGGSKDSPDLDEHETGHGHHDENNHGHKETHGSHGETDHEHKEEIDEMGTILPVGTINDIVINLSDTELDIAQNYPLSLILAVDHNPGILVFDLSHNSLKNINLSFIPKITLEKLRNPEFKDIFLEKEYSPLSAISLFISKYIKRKKHVEYARIPRSPRIQIQKPIIITLSTLDVRGGEITNVPSSPLNKKSDIFLLTPPFGIVTKRYLIREKKFLLTLLIGILIGLFTLFGGIYGSLYAVQYNLENGLAELKSIRVTMDADIAEKHLQEASKHFLLAKLFSKSAYIVRYFGYKDTMNVIIHSTEGFGAIGEILEITNSLRTQFIQKEYPMYSGEYFSLQLFTNKSSKYTDFIVKHRKEFNQIHLLTKYAEYRFASIDTSVLSTNNVENINHALALFKKFLVIFDFIEKNEKGFLSLAGDEKPMKYLLLNQNKDEIRANGGFPGSAIEFEIYKGRLMKHTKRDIYYYDWHLYPYAETPPAGISEITKAFGIRDANYEPNFADSFITINRFFEKSGGTTLDGAFGIHQGLVEEILKVTGPITVTGVTEPFTDKNFSRNMSILVETEFGRKNSPKDILFSFIDTLISVIHSQGQYQKIITILENQIKSGQIVGYVRNPDAEKIINQLQSPPVYLENPNFIQPIFTSISGNKSDRYMQRNFILSSTSTDKCILENIFQIQSTHAFSNTEEKAIREAFSALSVDPKNISSELTIQGKGINKQYVRLLVPKSSKYISSNAKKVEVITTNNYYDIFAFYIDTAPGETSQLTLNYKIPNICGTKTVFGTQPGLSNYTFKLK